MSLVVVSSLSTQRTVTLQCKWDGVLLLFLHIFENYLIFKVLVVRVRVRLSNSRLACLNIHR